MVKQLAGYYYSVEGPTRNIPLNLLALYTKIVGQKLVPSNPRYMFSTWDQGQRPLVSTMERWVNKEIVNMRMGKAFEKSAIDALFGMGIIKVGIASPVESMISNWRVKAGRPFAQAIDYDDFVFDVHSKDLDQLGYAGHRFRAPLRAVKDSKIYSKDRKNLGPMPDKIYNLEGDERVSTLGKTTLAGDQEFEDSIDLWEIYLPRYKLIITFQEDDLSGTSTTSKGKALRVQNWIGPYCGPYHFLGLEHVPGNARPKAPISDLYDMHMNVNMILRKVLRQAKRCKEIMAVGRGAAEDADIINRADDGEAVIVGDVGQVSPRIYGVPNPQLWQLLMALKDLFNFMAGNLEIMGGLAPQAKTASQDQLMNQNSSATISVMQSRVLDHVSDVGKALAWFWHHDPYRVYRSEYQVPGSRGSIPTYSQPKKRQQLPFEDMDINVDPYSMQHQTPQSRLQALHGFITSIYTPLAQIFQQQGLFLDLNTFTELAGKYMDQPDLPLIFTTGPTPQPEGQPAGAGGGGMPQETTRNYVRRSLGGDSAGAREKETSDAMAQAASENSERNSQA